MLTLLKAAPDLATNLSPGIVSLSLEERRPAPTTLSAFQHPGEEGTQAPSVGVLATPAAAPVSREAAAWSSCRLPIGSKGQRHNAG